MSPAASRGLPLVCMALYCACGRTLPDSSGTETRHHTNRPTAPYSTSSTIGQPRISLEDVSQRSGIQFVHVSGFTEERYAPVANGSGLAVLDYDGDQILDLYFITGAKLPVDAARSNPANALYRGYGDMTFQDRTGGAGLYAIGPEYGQGIAVADLDNDGFSDIYLTNYGGNRLYMNQGDGSFRDATELSRTGHHGWSTGAAWFDADEDGALDLYVCSYAQWSIAEHRFCGDPQRRLRMFCEPTSLQPAPHVFYRSLHDGTFQDASETAGIRRSDGRGMGVVAADVNMDGHIDLFVANDLCPNFLFLGNGKGIFQDITATCGAALDASGRALSGMGVDAADVNEDGMPDLFVTNFWMQYNALYQNLGDAFFVDVSESSGLAAASRRFVGWGTRLQDLDNDGLPDVFVSNGHVDNNMLDFGIDAPYRQPAQLWLNLGAGKFEHVSEKSGSYFATSHVGRGAAFGDLNNDGWMDIVVNQCDESPAILQNCSGTNPAVTKYSSAQLQLVGRRTNRDAVGTRITAASGERQLSQQKRGGSSYLAAHDPRIFIGMRESSTLDQLTIYWPSGAKQVYNDISSQRCLEP